MRRLLSMLFIIMVTSVYAQFGPEQIISTQADGSQSVFVADLDGDNHLDVLSANKFNNTITWFKNMDGMGSFGPQIIVATLSEPLDVRAADLDGDNDMDVLAVAPFIDLVVWYENLDGNGTFSSQKVISSTTDAPFAAIAADVDGDLDLDVISASDSSGLAWYENLDGNGDFGPVQNIAVLPNNRSVFASDLDNDNDLDLVVNSSGSNTVFWFENVDGQGNFSSQIIVSPGTIYPNAVFCIDLDGDDDIDILTAINSEDKIAWHENLDGMGNFSGEQVISTEADFARAVYAADLDNDLDNDVISASSSDGKIAWYENLDGQGDFSAEKIVSINALGARDVFTGDADSDGDMDIFSASQNDNKIAWYENQTFVGIEDYNNIEVSLTPNPANDQLNISAKENISAVAISNVLGQELYNSNVEALETTLDLSNYANGTYFVTIVIEGNSITKKVIKE